MSEFAVIVQPARTFGYIGRVVYGNIHCYIVGSTGARKWRPTATWAKAVGERWIKREIRARSRKSVREMRARKATGYEDDKR